MLLTKPQRLECIEKTRYLMIDADEQPAQTDHIHVSSVSALNSNQDNNRDSSMESIVHLEDYSNAPSSITVKTGSANLSRTAEGHGHIELGERENG